MTEQTSTAGNNILSAIEGDAVMSHAQVLYNLRDFLPDSETCASAINAFGAMAGKPLTSQEIGIYHSHIAHIDDLLEQHDWDEQKYTVDEDAKMRAEIRRVLNALSQLLPAAGGNRMSLQQAEICRQVADIIDFRPDEFDMGWWEDSPDTDSPDCTTVACIGGHVGLMHDDSYNKYVPDMADNLDEERRNEDSWLGRQAGRIGLDFESGRILFAGDAVYDDKLSRLLRAIGKYVEQSSHEYRITPLELEHIIWEEGLRPKRKLLSVAEPA